MVDADEVVVERLPPDEAFELLAHETRLRVLETLNESAEPLAFGELRERVGVSDPGGFNYHLRKLADRFVHETDEGYELTTAGSRVVGAVLSGGYTKVLNADPIPLDAACPRCGTDFAVRFDDHRVFVVCEECGYTVLALDVPAGVLEDCSRREIPGVVDHWLKRFTASLDYGLCPNCDSRLDKRLLPAGSDNAPEWVEEYEYGCAVAYDCRHCGGNWQTSLASAVVFHPAGIAFHHEHGVNLRETPMWKLDWLVTSTAQVTTEDPLRIDVPITLDDETRVFTVNADLDIVDEHHE